jgi:predicted negative regulator of RcsB-dependent stress response
MISFEESRKMAEENKTLEQLKESNFSFVASKPFMISAFIVILGGVIGVGVWSSVKEKKRVAAMEHYNDFKSGAYQDFKDKKINSEQFLKAFSEYAAKDSSDIRLILTIPEIAKTFEELNQQGQLAQIYQKLVEENPKEKNFFIQLTRLYYAFSLEDQGKVEEAIKVLEQASSDEFKFLNGLKHFHTGRFMTKVNNIEGAKKEFQKVIDQFPDSEEAKMAEIYLVEIVNKPEAAAAAVK